MKLSQICFKTMIYGDPEPKWVNFDYIGYGVNSLRLGDLHIR